jgi:hypothetical protein
MFIRINDDGIALSLGDGDRDNFFLEAAVLDRFKRPPLALKGEHILCFAANLAPFNVPGTA